MSGIYYQNGGQSSSTMNSNIIHNKQPVPSQPQVVQMNPMQQQQISQSTQQNDESIHGVICGELVENGKDTIRCCN